MTLPNIKTLVPKSILFLLITGMLAGASVEFYNVSWGTGTLLGEFSLKWGMAFLLFVGFCILCLVAAGFVLWDKHKTEPLLRRLVTLRERMGRFRWLAAIVVLILPIWFFQYSPWGVVFSKPYTRLLIWCLTILLLAFFLSQDSDNACTWPGILIGAVLCGAGFVLTNPLGTVTSYPFSLGWSEGNRLWDYSLLFGKQLYVFPPKDPPSAYLDLGRQLVGGLPFLIPHLSVGVERFWIALMEILPYLLLGWLAFRPAEKTGNLSWILAGVWSFMFLNQGPIHAPLLVCAILVVFAWRKPLWAAIPLVAIAGYFALVSRTTYVFAPAMWVVMLEFGGAILDKGRVGPSVWGRSISLGLAGLLGGFGTQMITAFQSTILIAARGGTVAAGVKAAAGVAATTVTATATNQPLLWYRLFPNATYGYGILFGLLVAVGPLLIILFFQAAHDWKLNLLQKLSIILPLAAFLVVGLIVSTKIGGGGDLHNMDMFLIGLIFSAAIAWRAKGAQWVASIQKETIWMQAALLLLIVIPAYQPLMALRPLSFAQDANWLAVLADAKKPKDLGSLPSDQAIQSNLLELRGAVKTAEGQGDVLFLDQRQLLTFGYIENVTLVPEYEKKQMMDQALSSNANYFKPLLCRPGLAPFFPDHQRPPADTHQGQRLWIWRGEQRLGQVGGQTSIVLLRRERYPVGCTCGIVNPSPSSHRLFQYIAIEARYEPALSSAARCTPFPAGTPYALPVAPFGDHPSGPGDDRSGEGGQPLSGSAAGARWGH